MKSVRCIFAVLSVFILLGGLKAQDSLSTEDYARAESRLSSSAYPLLKDMIREQHWVDDLHLWYRKTCLNRDVFVWFDVASKKKSVLFDNVMLSKAMCKLTGKQLPSNIQAIEKKNNSVYLKQDDLWYLWDAASSSLTLMQAPVTMENAETEIPGLSPDGKLQAYIVNYNLWVRNLLTGQTKQLTFDGKKDDGYATDNAGWRGSPDAVVKWSPDSKKIATFQLDERNVGDMYLVSTNVGHPVLSAWKYPLAGDSILPMMQRVVIDVEKGTVVRLKMKPDFHRGTLLDDISKDGVLGDLNWNADGSEFVFVSTSRDHKQEWVRRADALTGAVSEIFTETISSQFESGRDAECWFYLPTSNEIIWYSERDNWGHLYLYDARTGQLKHQITRGPWVVSSVLKIDEKKRSIYFMAYGLQPENPYFLSLCCIDFTGKGFRILTPETGNHKILFSTDKHYFTDNYSQTEVPPVVLLRDLNGKKMEELERTDISALKASGWKAPQTIKLKAADGVTDIYGLIVAPSHIERGKLYPIIDYIYPGPCGGSVGSWSFLPADLDFQSLSELGFYVVAIEGSGNPYRSKSFHDQCYGHMSINTLPDQVAGIRQLFRLYPIDTTRVGIYGHSGGGFATAAAMFRYPDFFKVGISESGNHDNRNYEDDWGERYNGLKENVDYSLQANELYAGNLKGKLLIAHGMMDENVTIYNSMLVIEALEKANKDYDLIVFPNLSHFYGSFEDYMTRRRWDYFVRNLLGKIPPFQYLLGQK